MITEKEIIITRQEAAQILGVKEFELNNLEEKGLVQSIGISREGTKRYVLSHIEDYKHKNNIQNHFVVKLCECGCGLPAPLAERNWFTKGIIKGQPLRFVCGHHRRGQKQSKEEKIKRSKKWGKKEVIFSPFLPNNRIVNFNATNNRWYCYKRKNNGKPGMSSVPHAREVYEYFYGEIPSGYVVHHKNSLCENLYEDHPNNLMIVPNRWNFKYFPMLANNLGVLEKEITNAYIEAIKITSNDIEIFKIICKIIIDKFPIKDNYAK